MNKLLCEILLECHLALIMMIIIIHSNMRAQNKPVKKLLCIAKGTLLNFKRNKYFQVKYFKTSLFKKDFFVAKNEKYSHSIRPFHKAISVYYISKLQKV